MTMIHSAEVVEADAIYEGKSGSSHEYQTLTSVIWAPYQIRTKWPNSTP